MAYYKVFGSTISCRLSFQWPIEKLPSADIVSCKILQSKDAINHLGGNLFYASSLIDPQTSQPKVQISSSAQGIFLSYSDYHFEIQLGKIKYSKDRGFEQQVFESLLFRVALVLWLELIGMPVLHASGIVINDSAIGFLADSTIGKSTLAAAFVRGGAKLLTDDILPVEALPNEYRARPSYAWLRLLPETAKALDYKTRKNVVHPDKSTIWFDKGYGRFCSNPVTLAALYLPMRKDNISKPAIEILSPRQAYLGLLQHSFVGKWLIKSPLNFIRLNFFANMVKMIPIKRLVYPSGYEHLPAVVDAIIQDLSDKSDKLMP